jgi:hypothetical protein
MADEIKKINQRSDYGAVTFHQVDTGQERLDQLGYKQVKVNFIIRDCIYTALL